MSANRNPQNLTPFAVGSQLSFQNDPIAVQPAGGTLNIPLNRSGFLVGGYVDLAFDFAAAPGVAPTPGAFDNFGALARVRLASAGTTDFINLSGHSQGLVQLTRERQQMRGTLGSILEPRIADRITYLGRSSATRYHMQLNLRNILGERQLFSLLQSEGAGGLMLSIDLKPSVGPHPFTGYTQCTAQLTSERRLYRNTPLAPPDQSSIQTTKEVSAPVNSGTSDEFTIPNVGLVTGLWVYYRNTLTNTIIPTEISDYEMKFGGISAPFKEKGRAKLAREISIIGDLLPTGVHRFDFLASDGDSITMPSIRDVIKVVDATDVRIALNFDAGFTTWPGANIERVVVMEMMNRAIVARI